MQNERLRIELSRALMSDRKIIEAQEMPTMPTITTLNNNEVVLEDVKHVNAETGLWKLNEK